MLTCKGGNLCYVCACCQAANVGCVSDDILCKYSTSSGTLFGLNCASILCVCLDSVCSPVHIFGEMSFNTPLLFSTVDDSRLFLCVCVSYYFSQFRWWWYQKKRLCLLCSLCWEI